MPNASAQNTTILNLHCFTNPMHSCFARSALYPVPYQLLTCSRIKYSVTKTPFGDVYDMIMIVTVCPWFKIYKYKQWMQYNL